MTRRAAVRDDTGDALIGDDSQEAWDVRSGGRTSLRRLATAVLTVGVTLGALVTSTTAAPSATSTEPTTQPAHRPPVPAPAPTPERETMVVIGDSYSSYYGDHRSRHPGWWAILASDLGLEPVVDAAAGTGILSRSGGCDKSRYRARMDTIREHEPRILFIEGGRNDWRRCTADGRVVESTRTEIVAAAEQYFERLGRVWDELGRPRADVHVISPWGASRSHKAHVIRSVLRETSRARGFTWVPTRRLSLAYAPDGIHPNNAGSRFLRDQILQNSDLLRTFGRIPA